MNCPNCQQQTAPGATFCGNCGFQLAQSAQMPPPSPLTTPQNESQPPYQPAPTIAGAPIKLGEAHNNGKAIVSFVCGILGLIGWLIPIIGVILGVLALIFGTIALKSQKRNFAIIGTVLSVPVLAISIFFWVSNAQKLLSERSGSSTASSRVSDRVDTPCYSTKIASGLTLTMAEGSCTLQAIDAKKGEQVVIKVIDAQGIDSSNLSKGALADAENTVKLIPGGKLKSHAAATFAGKQSYHVDVTATDGSAGVIEYVLSSTNKGNMVVLVRTQQTGKDFSLKTIEDSWEWQ